MNTLKLSLIGILISLSSLVAVSLTTATAGAAPLHTSAIVADTTSDDACAGLTQIDASQDCTNGKGAGVSQVIKAAIEVLSYVVGAVSVIMVIVAGFKYVTSNGDSNSIGSAKSTLIYALVGLAVAVLAQVLAHFVFTQAKAAANNTTANITYLPHAIVRSLDA